VEKQGIERIALVTLDTGRMCEANQRFGSCPVAVLRPRRRKRSSGTHIRRSANNTTPDLISRRFGACMNIRTLRKLRAEHMYQSIL
jgi:hypothetical protein